jgi:maltooligosyltrehalose trehalohydrolase
MTTMLLLLPGTPMLFQGQEFGASTPFLYFADHNPDLANAVQKGRAEFLSQFPTLASKEAQECLAVPHDPATFERCKLNWQERRLHMTHVRLHRELLAVRSDDLAFQQNRPRGVDGAVLAPEAFALRFVTEEPEHERLLIVNLGRDLAAACFAEPLIAPPDGYAWRLRWSTDHPRYGGPGVTEVVTDVGWRIPGHSATILRPSLV